MMNQGRPISSHEQMISICYRFAADFRSYAKRGKPKKEEVETLVDWYVKASRLTTGCQQFVAVVIEDSNLDDAALDKIKRYAHTVKDRPLYALLHLLLSMPMESRRRLKYACGCGCLDGGNADG